MGVRRGGLCKKTLKPRPKECVRFVTQCVNRRLKQQGCDKGNNNLFQISSLMRTITGGRAILAKQNK